NGTTYAFQGTNPTSTVSIGAPGAERTITNLAAGRISALSTDAINGSQLFATNQAVDAIGAVVNNINVGGIKYFHANSTAADSSATGAESVAIGPLSTAAGANAIAAGNNASASGLDATAFGYISKASGDFSTAVGPNANATGLSSTAVGQNAFATAGQATALGKQANASAADAVALGPNATAGNAGAVALGSGSVTDVAVGTPSAVINGTTYAFQGTTPTSTVSIGAAGAERTITNVAAGRISSTSTDAINGSQLAATNQAVDAIGAVVNNINVGGGIKYFHANSTAADSSATGTDSVAIGPVATATGTNAIAAGVNSSASDANASAIGSGAVASALDATAMGYISKASGQFATAVGANANATGLSSTAIGQNAFATNAQATALGKQANASAVDALALGANATAANAGAVALGSGSVTDVAVATPSTVINGTTYAFQGTNPTSTVSVGAVGAERTITNLAAGRISALSTDA
ncbi:calcium-binding protein, partial [Mesorhizobium sp. M7A.F.Ca.US.014.04.1.1]